MKNAMPWIVGAVVLGVIFGFLWIGMKKVQAPTETAGNPEVQGAKGEQQFIDDSKDGAPQATVISYTDSGFSPSTLTIKKGMTVTFVNQSSDEMWIGSDEHPSHTGYDGTSKDEHCAPGYTGVMPLDQCGTGASFSFTFTKAGTWSFHNHRNDDAHGSVTVTE
jgi:plastocyanin